MTPYPLARSGGPADVCWHDGQIVVAYQDGPGPEARLVLATYTAQGLPVSAISWALGSDVGAFPRVLSAQGSVWLIYREGASRGGHAVLRQDGREVWRSDVPCGGNDPVVLGWDTTGRPVFAWQRAGTNEILSALCEWPTAHLPEGEGRPTGLSHIGAHARVVLVDDARGSVPGMTRPCWAGAVVAGEHPDGGVLVRAQDGRVLHVWPAARTYTPRVAVDAQTGVYAVVTWGSGVQMATFLEADLVAPTPVAPWPPGPGWTLRADIAEIDVAAYLLGTTTWARHGMHVAPDAVTYTHPFQSRTGPGWVQHTKFAPPDVRAATWTLTDQWIGLAFDGTNELTQGYRIVLPGTTTTAALYPRTMRVGVQHRRSVDVDILDLATSRRRAVTFAGWVEAVYDGPQIGEIPPTTHAVIWFEPASTDARGWREANIGAQGHGCWYWHQQRKAAGASPDMRWVGTRTSSRVPDPPPQYAFAPPAVAPITPTPPSPPMPTPLIPRDAFASHYTTVNEFYAADDGLQREGGMVLDGHADVQAMIQWGYDLASGVPVATVLEQIRQSDEWRTKHPDATPTPQPPPTPATGLRGRLRIVDGVYHDDAGPSLPVLCHAGDLLSRWTREPDAVRAVLATIRAAGYDGVRAWTVLHGDYWRGRELGPMHQGEAYWSHVIGFAAALRSAGLRWLVSQGDLLRALPRQTDRLSFVRQLALSVDRDLVLGVDAGNESWQNGEPDTTRLREVVETFRAACPCDVWSLTSPASELRADLDAYAGSVYDVHGYRDGRSYDKLRHIYSIAYEQTPSRRVGIQSEPFGPGARVSVTQNKAELTSGVMALACAVSLMARQAWVYFSGPGVISDEGERFEDMPGFNATCAIRDALPRDLMAFGALVHGGASQARRVFAVPGTDETRADHAIHADGRFVCAVYGPRWREVTQVRAAKIERRIDCGNDGYIIIGRIA